MMIVAFVVGIAFPSIVGWLLVRLIEGSSPVLLRWERAALGFTLGLTLMMFLTFLIHTTLGITLGAWTMIGVHVAVIVALIIALRIRHISLKPSSSSTMQQFNNRLLTPLRTLLGFSIVKILFAGTVFLFLTPPFLDDVIENWNLRAKVFVHDHALSLSIPGRLEGGVNAYPPTVPLAKAWLVFLSGGNWNEALANSLHLVWFAVAAILLYSFLRRTAGLPWALLGTYVFCSLPLVVMHATNPYADIFLATHVLAAGTMAASALAPGLSETQRRSFLRLAMVAAACLPFTKNEGLVIYFPIAVCALIAAITVLAWRGEIARQKAMLLLGFAIAVCAAIAMPWVLYKWQHGLAFGNAKGIAGIGLAFEPQALQAIVINTFLEGNWLLLPTILALLLIVRGRHLLRPALLPLVILAVIPYLGQIGIFTMTGLASEAIMQTGYARGLIHIVPLGVILGVMMLRNLWEHKVSYPP